MWLDNRTEGGSAKQRGDQQRGLRGRSQSRCTLSPELTHAHVCVSACGGQPWLTFLSSHPSCFETGSLTTSRSPVWPASSRELPMPTYPGLGLQARATTPAFLCGLWAHTCVASISPRLMPHFKLRKRLPTSWKITFPQQSQPGWRRPFWRQRRDWKEGRDSLGVQGDHKGIGGKPEHAQPVM